MVVGVKSLSIQDILCVCALAQAHLCVGWVCNQMNEHIYVHGHTRIPCHILVRSVLSVQELP